MYGLRVFHVVHRDLDSVGPRLEFDQGLLLRVTDRQGAAGHRDLAGEVRTPVSSPFLRMDAHNEGWHDVVWLEVEAVIIHVLGVPNSDGQGLGGRREPTP